jgi:hypothetical protein
MSKLPSEVLNLQNWYLTTPLPTGTDMKDPLCIKNPNLQSYTHPAHFHTNETNDAVVFSSYSGGATTTNTYNPRCELRETKGDGLAKWSTTTGVHTMILSGCTVALPPTRPSTVIGQIHRGSDDLIEIRCWIPKGKTTPVIDVFHDSTIYVVLDSEYTLGDKYTIKVVASNGKIRIFYNDAQTPNKTITASYSTCFFKAGSYIQCNPTKHGASPDEVTESWLYSLNVTHS